MPTEDSLSGNFSELQVVISSEPWQFRKRSHAPQIQVSYAARGRTRPAISAQSQRLAVRMSSRRWFPRHPKSKPNTPPEAGHVPPLFPHAPQIQTQYAARGRTRPAAVFPCAPNPSPYAARGRTRPAISAQSQRLTVRGRGVASGRQKIAFRGISVNFRWSFPLNRGSSESVPMRPKSKSHTPPEAGHAPPLVFPCAPNPSPYAARGRTRPAISAQSQRLAVRMSSRRWFPMRPKSKPIRRQGQDTPRNQRPVPTPRRQGNECGIMPTEDSLSGNFSELQVGISSEPWQCRKRSHAPQIQTQYAARGRTRPAISAQSQRLTVRGRGVASGRQKIAFRGISVNFRWSFPLNRGSSESVPMRPKSKSHTPPEAGHAPPLVFPCAPNPSPYAARGRTRPAISAQSQRLAVRMSSRRWFPMRPKSKPIRRQRQDPPRNQRPVPTPRRQGNECGIMPTENRAFRGISVNFRWAFPLNRGSAESVPIRPESKPNTPPEAGHAPPLFSHTLQIQAHTPSG